jgi:hypothetical protein
MVGDAAQHGFGRAFCRRKLPGNGDSDPIFVTGTADLPDRQRVND